MSTDKESPSQVIPLKNNLMTQEQAAEYLEVHPATLTKWRLDGKGPNYIQLGEKKIRYKMEDLIQYIDNSKVVLKNNT